MNTLPETIGGYQHLEPDVTVEDGDIYVEGGRPVAFCDMSIGHPVGGVEALTAHRVYRKMPVSKQYEPL